MQTTDTTAARDAALSEALAGLREIEADTQRILAEFRQLQPRDQRTLCAVCALLKGEATPADRALIERRAADPETPPAIADRLREILRRAERSGAA